MGKIGSLLVMIFFAQSAIAQTYSHVYFTEKLLIKEQVKSISVYESWIDDQVAYSGHHNRIRLAKNLVRETYFTKEGKKTRTLFFNPETETIRDYIIYNFDETGLMVQRDYYYPESQEQENGSDENILTRHYKNIWLDSEKLDYQLITMGDYEDEVLTDSITMAYDNKGRLVQERDYIFDKEGPKVATTRKYEYLNGKKTLVSIMAGEVEVGKEEILRDEEERPIQIDYFAGGEKKPRYSEACIYDPRGWLAEQNFSYDWEHHKKAESVVSRQNKYDDHGKLVEVHLDYGSGRRQIKFIDYGYFKND